MRCLRGKSRENPSNRNTAYEHPTGRRNGSATGLFPFATRRATDSNGRNRGGHHRAETLRGGVDSSARGSADAANRGQEPFSGQHEPRNPHAHERRHRHAATASRNRPHAEQRRYANVAQNSGRALLALIDDILDLSKIEARKVVLENLSFTCAIPSRTSSSSCASRPEAKRLDFPFARVAPEIPPLLRGDAHRLRQVLTNLSPMPSSSPSGARSCWKRRSRARRTARQRFVSPSPIRESGYGRTRPARAVLAIHPGGRLHHAQVRRHRARAGHLQAAGRDDGRNDRRR
jgi:hypothetical protein